MNKFDSLYNQIITEIATPETSKVAELNYKLQGFKTFKVGLSVDGRLIIGGKFYKPNSKAFLSGKEVELNGELGIVDPDQFDELQMNEINKAFVLYRKSGGSVNSRV